VNKSLIFLGQLIRSDFIIMVQESQLSQIYRSSAGAVNCENIVFIGWVKDRLYNVYGIIPSHI